MTIQILDGPGDWGQVQYTHDKEKYLFPLHRPTGHVFNNDPSILIRFKCLELIFATPVAAIFRSFGSAAEALGSGVGEMARYIVSKYVMNNENISFRSQKTVLAAQEAARSLFYGALMTTIAFLGVFAPHTMRRYYGHYERVLNRHPEGPRADRCYLAFCFQRIAVLPASKDGNQIEQMKTLENRLGKFLGYISSGTQPADAKDCCDHNFERMLNLFSSAEA